MSRQGPSESPAVPLAQDVQAVAEVSPHAGHDRDQALRSRPSQRERPRPQPAAASARDLLGMHVGRGRAGGSKSSTFHEIWRLAMASPSSRSRSIEANVWGNTVEEAAGAWKVVADAAKAAELAQITELLDQAILGGIFLRPSIRCWSRSRPARRWRPIRDTCSRLFCRWLACRRYSDVRRTQGRARDAGAFRAYSSGAWSASPPPVHRWTTTRRSRCSSASARHIKRLNWSSTLDEVRDGMARREISAAWPTATFTASSAAGAAGCSASKAASTTNRSPASRGWLCRLAGERHRCRGGLAARAAPRKRLGASASRRLVAGDRWLARGTVQRAAHGNAAAHPPGVRRFHARPSAARWARRSSGWHRPAARRHRRRKPSPPSRRSTSLARRQVLPTLKMLIGEPA